MYFNLIALVLMLIVIGHELWVVLDNRCDDLWTERPWMFHSLMTMCLACIVVTTVSITPPDVMEFIWPYWYKIGWTMFFCFVAFWYFSIWKTHKCK